MISNDEIKGYYEKADEMMRILDKEGIWQVLVKFNEINIILDKMKNFVSKDIQIGKYIWHKDSIMSETIFKIRGTLEMVEKFAGSELSRRIRDRYDEMLDLIKQVQKDNEKEAKKVAKKH